MRREAACFIQVIQIVPIIGVTDTSIASWGGELSAEVDSSSFANILARIIIVSITVIARVAALFLLNDKKKAFIVDFKKSYIDCLVLDDILFYMTEF